jgi:glutaredoxin
VTQTKTVVFYSKEKDCPPCDEAKRWFKANDVQYDYRDVVEHPEYVRELVQQYRVMSVPVLVVGDEHYVGFDAKEYKRLILD